MQATKLALGCNLLVLPFLDHLHQVSADHINHPIIVSVKRMKGDRALQSNEPLSGIILSESLVSFISGALSSITELKPT